MASGNYLISFVAQDGVPPATTYATQDTITGASTPAEAVPVLDFDGTSDEFIDFYGVLPAAYAGGGLTLTIAWSSSAATTGDVVWGAAFRAIVDDAEDLDTTAFTYAYNFVTSTTASAIGEVQYADITFTDGADMDSLAVGEQFILRVKRDPDDAADTMSGDGEIHGICVKET